MTRRLVKVGAVTAVFALGLGLAGCGDDSDDDASTGDTTPTAADPAAYCDALIDFNGAVFQYDINPDSSKDDVTAAGQVLAPKFQKVADNAPADLSDTADELNDSVQGLLDGDAEAFSADATFEKYTSLMSDSIDECDFPVTDVTAVDYAFEGLPATFDAGTQAFKFINSSSKEEHELAILEKGEGTTESWDELLQLPEEQVGDKAQFKGSTFAPPGGESATVVTLEPGSYVAVCFIPVGGAEDGPPHFTKGMKHEFTVE
jgi:hypothetical protein